MYKPQLYKVYGFSRFANLEGKPFYLGPIATSAQLLLF